MSDKLSFQAKGVKITHWEQQDTIQTWLVTHIDMPACLSQHGRAIRIALDDELLRDLQTLARTALKYRQKHFTRQPKPKPRLT